MTRSITVLPAVLVTLVLILLTLPVVFGYALVATPIAPLHRSARRMVNGWYDMCARLNEMI